ncbi:MAG: ABC transporter substrate-binding protein [Caldilineaceae bacterium]|nr:ABC transporter substrate-binding protein [Caldilineaceae bacterium]
MKKTLLPLISSFLMLLSSCAVATTEVGMELQIGKEGGPVGTSTARDSNILDGCVDSFKPGTDYFPQKIQPEFAQGWTVEYHDNFKLLTLLNPWRGSEQEFQYLLLQCGTPAPDGYADIPVIEVPVANVAALTTTVLPHLHQLALLDRLVAVEKFDLVNTSEVRLMIEGGVLQEVGSGTSVNTETLIDLDPRLIITFAYGNPEYDTHPKLLEAGLPVALTAGYMETTPLGRSEWLKATALFFNREAAADQIFGEMAARYAEMAELASKVEERPTVLVGIPRRDSWRVPGGNSYFARYIADAGGNYLWRDDVSTGSIPLSMESVFEQAVDVDIWLANTGTWFTAADILAADERYSSLAAVQHGSVYSNNAKLNEWGGNDYWETGVASPHLVLADLIKILHPELLPEHELIWFHQLQ